MEQELDTPWTRSTEHTNTQKRGNGQQTQKLTHPSSTRLMDRCLIIMNRVGMHKRTACWKQWLSLKNHTQGFLKTHVLKQ
ncbi:PB1-F2 protein [Influenza A virus (A/pheasant/Hong Kong/HH225/2008(H9N2))]|uniref:Protein PB1-F2 n=1 Tax=Influenza A virus (A/pheasant/Hong Kong/HH225/2008(H9N2)) TaxID=1347644 RepID=T1S6J9_9INFA|nr:PB1-F2 protein [Influenza A virus (A/pheasant/Hong Kong/HH225/2008(H9N2))]